MRERSKPSVGRLTAQRASSDRRKVAIQIARAIRLGKLALTYGHAHERKDHEGNCYYCGFKGRMFWVAWWKSTSQDGRIGFIHSTPYMCAVCLWQRFAKPGERLHEQPTEVAGRV